MAMIDNNIILSRFIAQEIEAIHEKYSRIKHEDIAILSDFIEKVEENQINFNPYFKFDNTLNLAKALEYENNIDLIKLYILLTSDLDIRFDLEEAKVIHSKLESEGYTQVGDYILYYGCMEQELESLAEEKLTERLEDVDIVMDLFSVEEIANMFVEGMSLENCARDYIEENGWHDALEMGFVERSYMDSNNNQVYHCMNEWSDI